MTRSPNRIAAAVAAVGGAVAAGIALTQGREPLAVGVLVATVVLLLGAFSSVSAARGATLLVGSVCLVVGFAGLFLIGTPLNPLELTALDEVALFAAATGLLAVGLGARRDQPASP